MPLTHILNTVNTKHLLTLDITDSKFVNDSDIKKLAQECCNLKEVNFSWCNNLTSSGIKVLLESCLKL